ncbi:unnamed protein product [Closterium sp. NIES-53]
MRRLLPRHPYPLHVLPAPRCSPPLAHSAKPKPPTTSARSVPLIAFPSCLPLALLPFSPISPAAFCANASSASRGALRRHCTHLAVPSARTETRAIRPLFPLILSPSPNRAWRPIAPWTAAVAVSRKGGSTSAAPRAFSSNSPEPPRGLACGAGKRAAEGAAPAGDSGLDSDSALESDLGPTPPDTLVGSASAPEVPAEVAAEIAAKSGVLVEMDVVRANFEEGLAALEAALKTCDLVAFDGEFTGLHVSSTSNYGLQLLDSPQQRYERVKEGAGSFFTMQLGFSALAWDEGRAAYSAHTFNFNIFPRPFPGFDLRFLCQARLLAPTAPCLLLNTHVLPRHHTSLHPSSPLAVAQIASPFIPSRPSSPLDSPALPLHPLHAPASLTVPLVPGSLPPLSLPLTDSPFVLACLRISRATTLTSTSSSTKVPTPLSLSTYTCHSLSPSPRLFLLLASRLLLLLLPLLLLLASPFLPTQCSLLTPSVQSSPTASSLTHCIAPQRSSPALPIPPSHSSLLFPPTVFHPFPIYPLPLLSPAPLPLPMSPSPPSPGVPYLPLEKAERERRRLRASFRSSKGGAESGAGADASSRQPQRAPIVLSRPEDRLAVGQLVDDVRTWVLSTSPPPTHLAPLSPPAAAAAGAVANGKAGAASGAAATKQGAAGEAGGAAAEGKGEGEGGEAVQLQVVAGNSFLRAALVQQLEEEFGQSAFYVVGGERPQRGPETVLLVRATQEDAEEWGRQEEQRQQQQLEASIGFTRAVEAVMRVSRERGVPLLAHNCLFDLAYLFHHFIRPMPDSLDDWRHQFLEAFPGGVYDTKHLVSLLPPALLPPSTSLSSLFEFFFQRPASPSSTPVGDNDKEGEEAGAGEGDRSTQPFACFLHVAVAINPGKEAEGEGERERGEGVRENGGEDKAGVGGVSVKEGEGEWGSRGGEQEGAGGEEAVVRVQWPAVVHGEGFNRYSHLSPDNPAMAHEAGFDAYMTAAVFIAISSLLASPTLSSKVLARTSTPKAEAPAEAGEAALPGVQTQSAKATAAAPTAGRVGSTTASGINTSLNTTTGSTGNAGTLLTGSTPAATHAAMRSCTSPSRINLTNPSSPLSAHRNRVNVMFWDVKTLPLDGPLPAPDRSNLFLLSGFDANSTTTSILDLFQSVGLGDVRVTWVDRTSAVVSVADSSLASLAVSAVEGSGWVGMIEAWRGAEEEEVEKEEGGEGAKEVRRRGREIQKEEEEGVGRSGKLPRRRGRATEEEETKNEKGACAVM